MNFNQGSINGPGPLEKRALWAKNLIHMNKLCELHDTFTQMITLPEFFKLNKVSSGWTNG